MKLDSLTKNKGYYDFTLKENTYREIDIKSACEWLKKECDDFSEHDKDRIHQFIEEAFEAVYNKI